MVNGPVVVVAYLRVSCVCFVREHLAISSTLHYIMSFLNRFRKYGDYSFNYISQ